MSTAPWASHSTAQRCRTPPASSRCSHHGSTAPASCIQAYWPIHQSCPSHTLGYVNITTLRNSPTFTVLPSWSTSSTDGSVSPTRSGFVAGVDVLVCFGAGASASSLGASSERFCFCATRADCRRVCVSVMSGKKRGRVRRAAQRGRAGYDVEVSRAHGPSPLPRRTRPCRLGASLWLSLLCSCYVRGMHRLHTATKRKDQLMGKHVRHT